MPYIEHKYRRAIAERRQDPLTPGELNYAVCQMVDEYVRNTGTGYAVLNEVIGALECAKLEIYRRYSPYEDVKKAKNGEVFTTADHFIRSAGLGV